MRRKRILHKIFPTYLLIILISILGAGGYISISLREFYISKTTKDMEIRALFLMSQLRGNFTLNHRDALDALCKTLGRSTSTRITMILPSGEVLADSYGIPQIMDNHGERPEVKEALAGRTGSSIHYSRILYEDMLYFAAPVIEKGEVIGAIRVAQPMAEINEALNSLYVKIALGGVFTAVLAAIMSLVVSRWISRPIVMMKEGAEHFARGEFGEKLRIPDIEELAGLADMLNQMAQNMDEKIRLVIHERNEREVILSSMQEGLLAVDVKGCILTMNSAMKKMFGIRLSETKGRPLLEVIRNIDLRRFIAQSIKSGKLTEAVIALPGPEERFLQVHGSILRNAEGENMGTLTVLNDITRVRLLENMRKEFIANISHEIKTPITSIKACVETLRDEGGADADTIQRFLDILARQTDRLNNIIDDLLTLSRIEWLEEKSEIKLEEVNICDLLQVCILESKEKSSARKVEVILKCDPGFSAVANPSLLEQAAANLLDNAIKYSKEGGTVIIDVSRESADFIIKVIDNGYGIAREHLSRIFERFYRVDKDRSRQSGGTGLGLAIVKHIAYAHGGTVRADSTPGKGSTFTLRLPISGSA
ncbi:MAG: PAS domain-containing protein [Deltaproteobacteria bacterium]|nr:PAS domain-containing protein [Deltaproteobacteria bacterium]